ncbi:MAG: MatK/TrnK amino terminal region [Bacteriophage sp.]|nr:MAG: MatK/TrnK amino terminal region [Bacteriophage sp.]
MKTYCKGLELTRRSVVEALHRWKKSDSGKENGWRVADEYGTETAFVDRIWLEPSTETLTFEPIRTYLKHDPNSGKLREISVESIKRQVCNYLCVGALEPLLAAKVGFWQVSSGVKGKGAALGMRKPRREVHRFAHHVHVDIRNRYGSMRTAAVEGLVARYVKNSQVLYLLHSLLSTMNGVLILGSYLSLRLAAFVISFAYHAVEEAARQAREARGMPGVVRRRRLFSRQLKAFAREGCGHRRARFGAARIVAETVEGEAQRRRAHRLRGLSHLVRSRAPGRLAKEALETTATRVRALHAQAHRALGKARVLVLGLVENGRHGAPDER